MVALQLFGLVKRPVDLRTAAGVKQPQLQYGSSGTAQSPACPGDVHAVFEAVAAGPFDNAGSDGKPSAR